MVDLGRANSRLAQLQSIFIHMLRSISDAYVIQMLNLHIRYLLMNYEKNWIGWSIFSLPLWLSQASYQDFLLADCCLTDMFQSSSESIVIVLICSFSFFKDATVICMQVPYKNLPIDTYTGPLSWLRILELHQAHQSQSLRYSWYINPHGTTERIRTSNSCHLRAERLPIASQWHNLTHLVWNFKFSLW